MFPTKVFQRTGVVARYLAGDSPLGVAYPHVSEFFLSEYFYLTMTSSLSLSICFPAAPSPLQTLGYGGGTNANGQVIPPAGSIRFAGV